jgi:surface protein
MVAFISGHGILIRVLLPSFFALTVNVIGLFFAIVFNDASSFNGDLNQWDVAKVTDMSLSK